MTIEKILKKLKQEHALMGEPAIASDLERCQKAMADNGFAPIPQDYLDFLTKCNGLEFDGIYFCGTNKVPSRSSDYMLKDIVSLNIKFTERVSTQNIVLGEGDCDVLYLYHPESGRYKVDMYGTIDEFDTFEALFADDAFSYLMDKEN